MSYQEEFTTQWKQFSAIVESDIIRQIKSGQEVSMESLHHTISAERNRWFDLSRYQGIWLKRVKEQDVKVGQEIEKVLKGIRIAPVPPAHSVSLFPFILADIIIGGAIYWLMHYLPLASWQVIGSSVLSVLIFSGVLYNIWRDKKTAAKMKKKGLWLAQFEQYRAEILRLCAALDQDMRR